MFIYYLESVSVKLVRIQNIKFLTVHGAQHIIPSSSSLPIVQNNHLTKYQVL